MTPLFAGLLSGGVSLLGGLLGRNDAKKQAAAQRAAEERAHELALGEAHRSRAELAEIEDWNREAVRDNNRIADAQVDWANKSGAASVAEANRVGVGAVAEANRVKSALGERYLALPKVDVAAMLKDADAAGFNPLTYLRSGVASLYSKSVDLEGYRIQTPDVHQPQAFAPSAYVPQVFQRSGQPGLPTAALSAMHVASLGSTAMGAVSDGFTAFMSQSRIQGQQAFQRELLNTSLAAIARGRKAGNKVAGSSFYVPATVTAGSKVEKAKKSKTLMYGGGLVPTDPGTSPAEDWSDRYGEEGPMSWLIGPAVAYQDAKHNAKGMGFSDVMGWIDRKTQFQLPTWNDLPEWARPGGGPMVVNVSKQR